MIKEKYLNDSLVYRKYLGDDENYGSLYAEYRLNGIMIREKYSFTEEEVGENNTAVYYFPETSVCIDKNGSKCEFPRPGKGDCCLIGEKTMRVTQIGYYTGGGPLSHIRLNLK